MTTITTTASSARSTLPVQKKTNMSSRERGKHYRARLKVHQTQLVRHVGKLRRQVRDLKLLAALQKQLIGCPMPVRCEVMKCVRDLLDENASTAAAAAAAATMRSSPSNPQDKRADKDNGDNGQQLYFVVQSFSLHGPREAPVLVLQGTLRGKLARSTINRLYCCMPGNTALLEALVDREVTFSSTRSLFFALNGSIRNERVETDYSTLFAALAPTLRGLSYLLKQMEEVEHESKWSIQTEEARPTYGR